MVNLNWPEQERGKLRTAGIPNMNRRVTKEANMKSKANISTGVVLCSRCKCESELKGPVLARPKDIARQKAYQKPAQSNRKMTEQPKKEIPIKMPRNDKPLATIIEGKWYSIGKNGRPTLELTKTQKRRVQRQYCTFLKNKGNTQVVPELEPSQSQGQSGPIPVEGHEGWIEEYEEEQLDYEPSADDQIGLLETSEKEDWTEEYGEEQMEYDGELDDETKASGADLESLLQGDLGINMVFILSEKFRVAEGQENTLEGVYSHKRISSAGWHKWRRHQNSKYLLTE
ncbi:unnamed protein product [Prunus armeniaca]